MFYYIGSPRVLELGSLGDLPAKESQLVNEPVSPNFGEFEYNGKLKKINFDTYKANKKCLKVLFDFINDKIDKDKIFELYTCWADEETFPRNKKIDRVIDLSVFKFKNSFYTKDKQYIKFIKSYN
jgi:hypothetical protein